MPDAAALLDSTSGPGSAARGETGTERIRTPGFRLVWCRLSGSCKSALSTGSASGNARCWPTAPSVKALQAPLDHNATPPQWDTTADAILTRFAQICRTYEMVHWAHSTPLVTTLHFTGTTRETCLYNMTCANAQGMI